MVMLQFWAYTLSFIGKLLIAVAALLVHHKISKEKTIDNEVLVELHLETFIGIIAILLITVGYGLHMAHIF